MHKYLSLLSYLVCAGSAAAQSNVVISEVNLATSQVELVNIGDAMANLTSYRWCNRVNGNPVYPGVSASTINAGLSTATGLVMEPGEIITFDLTAAFLPADRGELGLYLPSSAGGFSTRAAMVDYINWGTSTGTRDSVAAMAPAIWVLNTAIDVSSAGAGDTIQLNLNAQGNVVEEYSVASATLGVAQSVPLPPVIIEITEIGFVDVETIYVEFIYSGSGTIRVSESGTLTKFTDVSSRTKVSSPTSTRREFAAPSSPRAFFLIEEVE